MNIHRPIVYLAMPLLINITSIEAHTYCAYAYEFFEIEKDFDIPSCIFFNTN